MITPIPTPTKQEAPRSRLERLADAVMLEGYLLYPYRATAPKNRLRFSFGVLAPRVWSEATGSDRWWMESQVLVRAPTRGELRGTLRFLQLQARRVQAPQPRTDSWIDVESLEVDGDLILGWEEGVVVEVDFGIDLRAHECRSLPFCCEENRAIEHLLDAEGSVVGRLERERWPIEGMLHLRALPAGEDLLRLDLRVENLRPSDPLASREEILRSSPLSTHLLLTLDRGRFVSLLDPPREAAQAAERCVQQGLHPVLAGAPGDERQMLACPFILYDYPQIAPESGGDFFDATEIDELLSLRTATLTDEEKRIARATDPRAAAIVDRVETMNQADWERLHGARRGFHQGEMVPLGGEEIGPGRKVRLRPGKRRTDAQDLLYAGMVATVRKVEVDADGLRWLAVTLDDDPAAELHRWYGRFHYYLPEEVEPLGGA